MKKLILLSLLTCLVAGCRSQDTDVTGTWNGRSKVGLTELAIVFHFEKDDTGYSGTMDSPDQGARGIPLSSVIMEGNELTVEITGLNFKYKGTVKGDAITGSFTQMGGNFKLDLARGEHTVNRPQEPLPPYPYKAEEVSFKNEKAGVELAGTLTLPVEGSKFPAVIMVTGSGPQDRNEELFGHKPFLVISDFLTRNGIAVLRYDDRGTAGSTGDFAAATTEDFVWDALAAFDYLKTRNDIQQDRIGVIGHSEGGSIAFMMAARQPELGFIVSMAGATLRGDSILILQNRDLMLAEGMDKGTVDNYCAVLSAVYKIKTTGREIPGDPQELRDLLRSLTGYAELPTQLQNNLVSVIQTDNPWFNYFIHNDITGDIKKTSCSVFAINGDKDLQVEANANIGRLEEIFGATGKKDHKTRIYPGLNHMFQECTTGAVAEYGQIEQTISPQVLEDMKDWILEVTKKTIKR